jgi:hypothetical protein
VLTKRDLAALRRIERRILAAERRRGRLRQLSCFWSWPLGHVRDSFHICLNCGHDARLPHPAELVVVRERARR